jgi:hypothetical protein
MQHDNDRRTKVGMQDANGTEVEAPYSICKEYVSQKCRTKEKADQTEKFVVMDRQFCPDFDACLYF